MPKPTTFSLDAYRFFKSMGGGIVGRAAIGAATLARAERIGRDLDWTVEWEWDSDGDLGDHDMWCKPNRVEYDNGWRDAECSHEILGAVLKTPDGEVLGSLWSIIDPDRDYRRYVEAELISEAIAEGFHHRRAC